MKNTYLATTVQENGKRYAYIVPVSSGDNLLSVIARIKGVEHINAYPTKKEAKEVVEFWNECYKINGTYMFSECFA